MILKTENSFIGRSEIDTLLQMSAEKLACCFSDFPMTGWLDMPEKTVIDDITKTAREIQKDFDAFVVCGIGGSALGAKAVHVALNGVYYNENRTRKFPKLFIEDNIDSFRAKELFDTVDIRKTIFNFVSKSGGTMETLAQLLLVTEKLDAAGLDLSKHIIVTVGNKNNDLYRFAEKRGIKIFWIPKNVGGRFSIFTPAGLLPLQAAGVDIKDFTDGARGFKEKILKQPILDNPAAVFAAANFLAAKKGKSTLVMMPYIDSFRYISDWFCQLWGESLGKGGKGQTPVAAIGSTDQHSLLQLLMEGADDKIVTFIEARRGKTDDLATGCGLAVEGADFKFYSGKSFSDLQHAALTGTRQALTDNKRSNITISLDGISVRGIGELLMFFMLATAYCGTLYGINPYDQPGVEAGKKITKKTIENS